MFQRRVLEVLVLCMVIISAYYLKEFLSSDYAPESFRLRLENLYSYLLFIMAVVMYYMSVHHSIMYCYDRMKFKKKEKALEFRKKSILIDRLEREKNSGGALNDPYSQALQHFIISEVLTPSSKRKNMNLPDSILTPLPLPTTNQPLTKPILPPPPPPTTLTKSKTIMDKLTPNTKRKTPKPIDHFVDNNNFNHINNSSNTTTPISVHTPQTSRKLLSNRILNKDNNKSVDNMYPTNTLQKIIAELKTPKSNNRHLMQGHTNLSMSNDHIA